ncbi:MAG: NUDIX hydrolase [Nitrososphaerota archaeon]
MEVRRVSSETVLRGRVFNVRWDLIRVGGRDIVREVVEHPGAVVVVPLLDNGEIILVKQYRYAVDDELLEVPAGTLEPDEAPEKCAERELLEETGFRAGRLTKIGQFYLAPGYSTELMHVFVAEGLVEAAAENQEDEVITVLRTPLREAMELVRRGVIKDAKTITSLFIFRDFWLCHS